jgi:hypothetical protein
MPRKVTLSVTYHIDVEVPDDFDAENPSALQELTADIEIQAGRQLLSSLRNRIGSDDEELAYP